MKKIVSLAAALVLGAALCPAQAPAAFEARFTGRALRFDMYQTGDAKSEMLTIDAVYEEPLWPETRTRLVDPFNIGRYMLKVYDVASNALLYSRGFDTMFAEYKTTTPALEGVVRVFQRSLRIPEPRKPFLFVVEGRDKKNILHPVFTQAVDPADYHIRRETPAAGDWIYEAVVAGDPKTTLDLVFVAEGYTASGKDKFKTDVDRMTKILFETEPYKSAKGRISVRGVFRPSPERSMDEPRQRAYRKTVLDAGFNAFDLDRYMLIEKDHRLHEIAAQAPYDAIIVLVDSARYGGGSICFDYCVTTTDNARSLEVFLHEMGHSFGGLADEYYTSEVAYNDFYPKGVEPLEPNITALLDPAALKWKDLLSPGIAIPTEYGKEALEALQAERQARRKAAAEEIARAKEKGADAAAVKAIQDRTAAADKAGQAKMDEIRKTYAGLADKVGVFEGAGYSAKGLYRAQMVCIMIGNPKIEFCAVCRRALAAMIDYYAER
ncbi:MAG: M64 family metallo-endopeptidase [Candidatus Aminicenantes bacterium]|nr:M64 family metallo-endopeptidase [Candidatus Aminicenantes bacterium]